MAQPDGSVAALVSGLSIRRLTTSQQVAEGLREMIVRGELEPGAPLREVALAESIGVSRNTIREALRELAREGLVRHTLHRGAVVTELTVADVEDLFRVRRTVEIAGIEASRNATHHQVGGLRMALEMLTSAAESRDWHRIVEGDLAFHQQLVAFIGSERLNQFFSNIQHELRLCVSFVDREYEDPGALVAEHRELFETLARGDQRRCAALLLDHLDDAEERLRKIVAKRVTEESVMR